MKRIHLGQTFDDSDCVQSGYVFTIGMDREGYYRLYAEYRTRWQGKTTGTEWREPEQYLDQQDVTEYGTALLKMFSDPDEDPGRHIEETWEKTKTGVVVR